MSKKTQFGFQVISTSWSFQGLGTFVPGQVQSLAKSFHGTYCSGFTFLHNSDFTFLHKQWDLII